MKKRSILSLIAVAGIAAACGQQRGVGRQAAGNGGPVFLDETRTIEERVEDALSNARLEKAGFRSFSSYYKSVCA